MGEISKNQMRYNLFCIVIMCILMIFIITPIYQLTDSARISCNVLKLDRGWTVTVHEKTYENVTLSDFNFEMCNYGDRVTYSISLPVGSMIHMPVLKFYSIHSVVDVYLDDEKIYSYGHELYEAGELIGYGQNFISLPDDYAGKELRIELLVSEDNAFEGQQSLSIADGNYIFRKDIAEHRSMFAISLFLLMFGIIVMILSIIMRLKNESFTQTFCIAGFSFLVGAWTFCNSDLIEYVTTDLSVKVSIEYLTFFALPLPFTFYFKSRIEDKRTPVWLKICFWLLCAVDVGFFLTVYICQQLNLSHYPKYVGTTHIIMVFTLLFIILLNFVEAKNKRTGHSAIAVGFVVAVIVVIWELLRFNLSKYFVGFENNEYNSSIGIAILIVVISLIIDFSQDVSQNVYKSAQQKLLEQMAYMDELTGLSNRRRCEETLLDLKQRAVPYAVLSLDMNFLKKVNDSLGHEKGDALLKRFSDMLMEVYGLHGTVGRMGGDEFIVIMPEVSKEEAEKLISHMKATMLKMNVNTMQLKLSTAYGLAMSDEVSKEQDAHAVYRLADERMYENKRQSKLGRT